MQPEPVVRRHADHDPSLICRPALGRGLCEVLELEDREAAMWCDSFDADLLKVIPAAAEALGDTAGVQLRTYSRTTDGKINLPSCWHTDAGLAAFFWTHPDGRPPEGYVTDKPEVGCTFLEAVRDEWVHGQVVVVNRQLVWRPPEALMMRLMYDLRGWGSPLTDAVRAETRGHVLASLDQAARRLRVAVDEPGGPI